MRPRNQAEFFFPPHAQTVCGSHLVQVMRPHLEHCRLLEYFWPQLGHGLSPGYGMVPPPPNLN